MTTSSRSAFLSRLKKHAEHRNSGVSKKDEYYLPRIRNKLKLVNNHIDTYNDNNVGILRVNLKELSDLMKGYFPEKEKTGGDKRKRGLTITEEAKRELPHLSSETIAGRIAALERHFGASTAKYIRQLFPELAELEKPEAERRSSWVSRVEEKTSAQEPESLPLPEQAPARWVEAKEPGDTPPTFIQRHYAPWLGKGLTRADVRHLDPQLSMALSNWQRKNELPEGFDKLLPTKSDHLRLTDQERSSELIEAKRHAWRLDKRRSRTEQER